MNYAQLIVNTDITRARYLIDVLTATVAEGRESTKPQGVAVTETLAAFSLNDIERKALQREAIERLHNA